MSVTRWDKRFFETTRGRILALLRRGSQTVDELAVALGVTDNAVRTHLAALERDGVVEQRGARPTGPAGGKPAFAYGIVPDAERLFTKAYIPVFTELVGVLAEQMTAGEIETLLGEVGRRLGAARPRSIGNVHARVMEAATILTELGGVVDVEEQDGTIVLRGHSCPLADAVRAHPATCHATQRLLEEIIGRPVDERCDKGERPHCRFEMLAAAGEGAA